MSNYARDFSDVTITAGSDTLQINSNDSNFAIAPGSRLFLNGFLPVTVTAGDTINRTLTLATPWPHADQINVPAALIPIGLGDWLLQALENNRAAYEAFVATIEGQEEPLTEVEWSDIVAATLPEFVKRWGKYSEITEKPDYAQGWPAFENVTGTVAREQLPQSVTDDKRTESIAPPVEPEISLAHRLRDYPRMLPVDEAPTDSPNNRREIHFDSVRQEIYFSFEDRFKKMPTTIESRKFAVFYRGLFIRLNSAFTGSIKMKVFPMGNGGNGLPNNPPFITDFEWQTIETTVTDLYKIGEFDSEYFEGIIDFVQIGNGWETLHTDKSYYRSLNGYFDVAFGTLRSPFDTFFLRDDGYWYSEDITPETPNSMGSSWMQNGRTYSVDNASDSNDALRFFSDSYDDFELEIIMTSNLNRKAAVTITNTDPNIIYYSRAHRFITNERIYIKRQNSGAPITGTITIESIRLRLPQYE
ncbi:hypothetical protein J5X92_01745 [Alteromonas sp. K632G]|uniref:hypothetical protein n=1 Tax=Alteromonas sp. K632G TaxID=2820757 RepID=UPI001AD7AFCA|nr:hypothetical protein [Alteromonas sp. K632G]MBO7920939.1 hypothetical protein [Alteromonas sp. K632G]